MFKVLLYFTILLVPALSVYGVDFGVAQGILTPQQFQCLIDKGKEFMIMQLWRSNGLINPYYKTNYETAQAVGIKKIDAYAFICNSINTPEQICNGIVNNLPANFRGRVYIDIEPWTGCWVGTPEERLKFAEDVATTCLQHGLDMGVYSCHWDWVQVFGSGELSSPILTKLPLWYAHYDGKDVFDDDFKTQTFGGWTTAIMKQYLPTFPLCGSAFDMNVY